MPKELSDTHQEALDKQSPVMVKKLQWRWRSEFFVNNGHKPERLKPEGPRIKMATNQNGPRKGTAHKPKVPESETAIWNKYCLPEINRLKKSSQWLAIKDKFCFQFASAQCLPHSMMNTIFLFICEQGCVSVCGWFGLWPSQFTAISVCVYIVLLPFWFIDVPVYDHFGRGHLRAWPLWLFSGLVWVEMPGELMMEEIWERTPLTPHSCNCSFTHSLAYESDKFPLNERLSKITLRSWD